jgi:hypothetical protein
MSISTCSGALAGGLGERLGFKGIKLSLPTEIATGTTQLQLYCAHIVALQALLTERLGRAVRLPLCIMTSADTHQPTLKALRNADYFGLSAAQVSCLMQGRVAAIADDTGALAARSPYTLLTKPHGHGDVHSLLHASGLASRWAREGVHWLYFMQDSSTTYWHHHLASLGVALELQLDCCFVATPRTPKMALGILATMTRSEDGLVAPLVPVEYNQIEALLRGGDVAGRDGYSDFPGNTNGILVRIQPYLQAMERTGGRVEEFVNPKYTDGTRASFKAPTRLECLMQDFAWSLRSVRSGFALYPPTFGYWPCKNDLTTAAALSARGVPAYGAATAEMAVYQVRVLRTQLLPRYLTWYPPSPPIMSLLPAQTYPLQSPLPRLLSPTYPVASLPPPLPCDLWPPLPRCRSGWPCPPLAPQLHASSLRLLGCAVPPPAERAFHGVTCPLGAAVVLHPSFAPCLTALRSKLPTPQAVSLSARSTLLVRGRSVRIERLRLDGCLEIDVCDGASLVVRDLAVVNDGWRFDELSGAVVASEACPEVLRMRGYTLRKHASRRLCITVPGAYEVDGGDAIRVDDVSILLPLPHALRLLPGGDGALEEPSAGGNPPSPRGQPPAVGGALLAPTLPPPRAAWSARQLELAPQQEVSLPLVLPEPSVATVDIRPSSAGLVLSLLSDGGRGPPALPPVSIRPRAAHAPPSGGDVELTVSGSGLYMMLLRNTNLLTSISFSANVAHEPLAERQRAALKRELAGRKSELEGLVGRETELEATEAALAHRLWEVQETRRRHSAMAAQLQEAVASLEARLATPPRETADWPQHGTRGRT